MAGECQEHAQRARQAAQEIAAADIGKEADRGFRHREQEFFGRHRVRAMHREADTAAHVDAVDQRYPGLGVTVDAAVEDVLIVEEVAAKGAGGIFAALAIEIRYVAAGTEGAIAGAAQHHRLDGGVLLPTGNDLLKLENHDMRQRIQRLGPIERDQPQPALDLKQYLRLRHPHPINRRREMTTRMISLVPSRIWCTRKSRK